MPERLQPNPNATEVYHIYQIHVVRGNAAIQRRRLQDLKATEGLSRQLLGKLPNLINQSEASDYWKHKLMTTLFAEEGIYNYNNGMGYIEAPGWYFGVYQTPEGLTPGIFDKQEAQYLETERMFFEAVLFQNQAMTYTASSPQLAAEIPQRKQEFREWANSYEQTYGVSILDVGNDLLAFMKEQGSVGIDKFQQQVASLKVILGVNTEDTESPTAE